VEIRPWNEDSFPAIQRLSRQEGWSTPIERPDDALRAWKGSRPALVAIANDSVIGFVRCVSDGAVTTYVAEVLVAEEWRGREIGKALLDAAQRLCPGTRLDLLATGQSAAFYERIGFRSFAGYRRSWAKCEDSP
jgi:ribosomal protein S18 acetylase RimI-like enzyme